MIFVTQHMMFYYLNVSIEFEENSLWNKYTEIRIFPLAHAVFSSDLISYDHGIVWNPRRLEERQP